MGHPAMLEIPPLLQGTANVYFSIKPNACSLPAS